VSGCERSLEASGEPPTGATGLQEPDYRGGRTAGRRPAVAILKYTSTAAMKLRSGGERMKIRENPRLVSARRSALSLVSAVGVMVGAAAGWSRPPLAVRCLGVRSEKQPLWGCMVGG
jgi:hypothetical protein